MYVHYMRRLCYIASPRTASRATAQMLVDDFGFEKVMNHHRFDPVHLGGSVGERAMFSTATCHRDHFSAVNSWMRKLHATRVTVSYPALTDFFRAHLRYFDVPDGVMWPHLRDTTFPIRYRHLHHDLQTWLQEPVPVVPRVGATDPREVRWTPAAIAWMMDTFWDELERLEYV